MNIKKAATLVAIITLGLTLVPPINCEDWPMLGRDATRNAVSHAKNPPIDWNVGTFDRKSQKLIGSRNVKWAASLGSRTCGDPVVSDGLVWVGTNNSGGQRFDFKEDASVLMCFRESDGKLLYRYVSLRLPLGRVHDLEFSSLACSPFIEGDRMWFTTNRCETVCLDIGPLRRGEGEPRVVWKLDMMKQLGVFPKAPLMSLTRFCSVASFKDRVYVITGNAVDETWTTVPKPEAPSLICVNKHDGTVLWSDNSPGANILSGQWASPLVIEIDGKAQVIAPQGDGWLRAFEALSGKLIWKFDMNHKTIKWFGGGRGSRNNILATPVFYDGRVYLAVGQNVEDGEGPGRLCCIDPTKSGDISSELAVDADGKSLPHRRLQAVNPEKGEKAIENPNSGLIWEYTGVDQNGDGKIEFEEVFHRSVSSVAIKDDMLTAADSSGLVHCFDAKTGKRHWYGDVSAATSAAPLIVDDKVYVADDDGDVAVFNLMADPKNARKGMNAKVEPINTPFVDNWVYVSPIFANGTLYVANNNTLFAIQANDKETVKREKEVDSFAKPGYWPQWRGPNRDNVSPDTGLLKEWPKEGPPLVWKTEGLGTGYPSVAVAGSRVFLVGYQEESEHVIALEEATGRKLWNTEIKTERVNGIGMSVMNQRTPTVDEDRLYVVSRDGKLLCLHTADGTERWRRDFVADFAGTRGFFGYGTFPLVDGERLVCSPGGEASPIVALNKQTGETIWRTTAPQVKRPGHSAIVVAEVGGIRQYIQNFSEGTVAVAADDGRFLWHYDRIASGSSNAHSPVVRADRVLCTNGWNTGIGLLQLSSAGRGIKTEELYFNRAPLDHWLDSTVTKADHIFLSSASGRLFCYDYASGEMVWAGASPVGARPRMTYADGHLYLHGIDGSIALVEANPKAYVEKSVVRFDDRRKSTFTFPVVTGGRLYLRRWDALYCYDLRAEALKGEPPQTQTIKLKSPGTDTGDKSPERTLRSVFVPTPQDVVERMLEIAKVKKTDVVVDLGSGDGRIVITAAQKYGTRAIGYEIDKDLVELSRENIAKADVKKLATIHHQDLFAADLTEADVVAVYLLPKQLEKLLPQLKKLKPGARIVSHEFLIPGVEVQEVIDVESTEDQAKHKIYRWTTPLQRESK